MYRAEQATHLASLVVVVYIQSTFVIWLLATDVASTVLLFEHALVVRDIDTVLTDARDALLGVSFISVSRHTLPIPRAVP